MHINGNGLFPLSVPCAETNLLYETLRGCGFAMKRHVFADVLL